MYAASEFTGSYIREKLNIWQVGNFPQHLEQSLINKSEMNSDLDLKLEIF